MSSSTLPGPKLPPALQLTRWVYNPTGFLDECVARHGPTFRLRFPGHGATVYFTDPAVTKAVFATERDNFQSRDTVLTTQLEAFVGEGSLILMNGPRHRQERQRVDPLLHGRHLASYADLIREVADRVIDRLPTQRAFPLFKALEEITVSVIIRCIFGIADDQRLQYLKTLIFQFLDTMIHPLNVMAALTLSGQRMGELTDRHIAGLAGSNPRRPSRVPWRRAAELKAEIYAVLGQEIERCRKHGIEGRGDVLARLVTTQGEDGQPASETALCGQLLTFLLAGHSATAISLNWALGHILERPDVEQRVRQELHQTFGDALPSPERSAELKYLDAVLKESLRLHPIPLVVTRRLREASCVGGYELAADTEVGICTYLLHRHPDLWDEPDDFRPERFLEKRPSPYEYCPFGGGYRTCIGNAFAVFESRVVVARMLARVALRLAPGAQARTSLWTATPMPKGGLPVIVDKVLAV